MAHVLLLPFAAQGHISPMMQFARGLIARGLKVTLATTVHTINSTKTKLEVNSVTIAAISDGYDEGGYRSAPDFDTFLESLKVVGSRTLTKLIEDQSRNSSSPFTCLVYEPILYWAADVAKSLGLPTVGFSTKSCIVSAIFHHVDKGIVDVPEPGTSVSLFGLPPMERAEFPLFHVGLGPLNLIQFKDFGKMDWLLFNSFDELESQAIAALNKFMHARAIGPCVPLVPTCQEQTSAYGISWHKTEDTCMKWLNTKPAGSVIYVSFGSIASLQKEQMGEVTEALRASGKNFLWVVKATEEDNLPKNFTKNLGDTGLIVRWSPQLEVLANKAVGCFITHAGWNSILEAICFGIPMVAMPVFSEQPMNAKCIEDVWGVGVWARAGEGGIVRRYEIERCVKDVMDGERSDAIRKNAQRWKESAHKAVSEGGSLDRNLNEFVAYVNSLAEKSSPCADSGVENISTGTRKEA